MAKALMNPKLEQALDLLAEIYEFDKNYASAFVWHWSATGTPMLEITLYPHSERKPNG